MNPYLKARIIGAFLDETQPNLSPLERYDAAYHMLRGSKGDVQGARICPPRPPLPAPPSPAPPAPASPAGEMKTLLEELERNLSNPKGPDKAATA